MIASVADPDRVGPGGIDALQVRLRVASPLDIGPVAVPSLHAEEQSLALGFACFDAREVVTCHRQCLAAVHLPLQHHNRGALIVIRVWDQIAHDVRRRQLFRRRERSHR